MVQALIKFSLLFWLPRNIEIVEPWKWNYQNLIQPRLTAFDRGWPRSQPFSNMQWNDPIFFRCGELLMPFNRDCLYFNTDYPTVVWTFCWFKVILSSFSSKVRIFSLLTSFRRLEVPNTVWIQHEVLRGTPCTIHVYAKASYPQNIFRD